MEKLSEMDASFVHQESNRTPMHISPVVIYDQSSRENGKVRFKEILDVFRRNLHKSSIFRRKLAGGAMGLDTPYWVEDPDFDLEFHVRHIALPKPGDWRQFCILLSRLQSRGLDMRRPLWEAYVIEGLNDVEGLPDNSFALMLKVHHAAIDGVSGAEIITAIHSLSAELDTAPIVDDWEGETDPSLAKVWREAYMTNLRRPATFYRKVRQLVPAVVRANKATHEDDTEGRTPMVRTRFNGEVSSTRVTDTLVMQLDDVKTIRKAVDGATVNDVILAIVGGGMRRYLEDKDELPETSLSCSAPISMRSARGSESHGNQVSQMTISLGTDVKAPLKRLAAIQHSSVHSKEYSEALGTSVIMDVSEVMVPQLMGWSMRATSRAAARAGVPLPTHTVVSNVPGPQFPLYLAGAKVHMMMGMGVLLDMMGLFHAVISGAGKITINATSTREMMPDPGFYRDCLEASFKELLKAAQAKQRKPRAKAKAKKKPRKS
ncbi:wax ester/triacylglycerol synthase family O-acyltransferase [Halioglobus maricola]|uniref:diacylglycerol O-acyltransferase n=1 Tax=Halioglobus maricola TaxID=2601894 RepID=A0A5P9NH87_9GAMM|nr:wax ester/triacylglycerol synthase family O-acyltransferase [Halioglobus maricola]QFU75161.1 wax ester/triacylglycerol synthase family O-acyltransferase [Halioglobus maricola]